VRNISAWHQNPAARGSSANPPPDVLTNPALIDGLRVLAGMGLSFEAWMYHTQLREMASVAQKVPEATIVLNPCGGSIGIGPYAGRRAETIAEWTALMREVSNRSLALCRERWSVHCRD
jgi:predicted TIM-barrel fold metal-dependent hydrolase